MFIFHHVPVFFEGGRGWCGLQQLLGKNRSGFNNTYLFLVLVRISRSQLCIFGGGLNSSKNAPHFQQHGWRSIQCRSNMSLEPVKNELPEFGRGLVTTKTHITNKKNQFFLRFAGTCHVNTVYNQIASLPILKLAFPPKLGLWNAIDQVWQLNLQAIKILFLENDDLERIPLPNSNEDMCYMTHTMLWCINTRTCQVSTCLNYIKHTPTVLNTKPENDHVQVPVISSSLTFSFLASILDFWKDAKKNNKYNLGMSNPSQDVQDDITCLDLGNPKLHQQRTATHGNIPGVLQPSFVEN